MLDNPVVFKILTLNVRDTNFRREGVDIHVDVGSCITQIGITRGAPTKARLGRVQPKCAGRLFKFKG
ncbi:unnamed protein product [Prunus armeniaca]